MNLMQKQLEEEYQLQLLTEQQIPTLYHWSMEEKHFDYYTCRPLKLSQSFEEYADKMGKVIGDSKQKIYVLVKLETPNIPLGKVALFDWNPRNHSAEFGYYLPTQNRGIGIGSIMTAEFIKTCFQNDELNLNKIYATTSSNNVASIKLLEKFHFKLDGRLREHYWIGENKYDQLVYSMLKQDWIVGEK